MVRVIRFSGWYTPALLQLHPDKTFVFGDNMLRVGMGGQAIIRNEPNAYGVVTKRKPTMALSAFMSERSESDLDAVLADLTGLWSRLRDGETIVIPVTSYGDVSLGLERARLKEFAPSIYATIVQHVAEMGDAYGVAYGENAEDLDGRS